MRRDLPRKSKVKALDKWQRFTAPELPKESDISKAAVITGLALAWKTADGKEYVKARMAAKGNQAAMLTPPGASVFDLLICRASL